MALDPCVKTILCTLSDSVLNTLKSLIDGQVALLQAQIVQFQTQVLQYDVIAIPVQAASTVAVSIINEVRSSAALVPLQVISAAQCVDLGDFNLDLQQSIDQTLSVAEDFVFEAVRLLSFRDELNAIIAEFNAIITQFTDIQSIIDECLAGT